MVFLFAGWVCRASGDALPLPFTGSLKGDFSQQNRGFLISGGQPNAAFGGAAPQCPVVRFCISRTPFCISRTPLPPPGRRRRVPIWRTRPVADAEVVAAAQHRRQRGRGAAVVVMQRVALRIGRAGGGACIHPRLPAVAHVCR